MRMATKTGLFALAMLGRTTLACGADYYLDTHLWRSNRCGHDGRRRSELP